MVALYKDVFVSYYYDGEEECIYAISAHRENYVLRKKTLEWDVLQGMLRAEYAVVIPRWKAEQIEDVWVDEYERTYSHPVQLAN